MKNSPKALQCGWILHYLQSKVWYWTWVLVVVHSKWYLRNFCCPTGAIPLLSSLDWFNWCRLSPGYLLLGGSHSDILLHCGVSGAHSYPSFALIPWRPWSPICRILSHFMILKATAPRCSYLSVSVSGLDDWYISWDELQYIAHCQNLHAPVRKSVCNSKLDNTVSRSVSSIFAPT